MFWLLDMCVVINAIWNLGDVHNLNHFNFKWDRDVPGITDSVDCSRNPEWLQQAGQP